MCLCLQIFTEEKVPEVLSEVLETGRGMGSLFQYRMHFPLGLLVL